MAGGRRNGGQRGSPPRLRYARVVSNAPDEVRAWAQARSEARGTQDWPEADRLRAAIEAAGWRVVDRGTRFSLEPAHAPDVLEGDRIRFGRSHAVPSRLDEPATAAVTVILVAVDQPADLARTLDGLRRHAPAGTQVVIVADRPNEEQEAALIAADGPAARPIGAQAPEIVWMSEPLGRAAAINAGARRSAAPIVVLLDTSVELTGDLLSPLVEALRDETVAVAGPWGLVSDDLRRFEPAEPFEPGEPAEAFEPAEAAEPGQPGDVDAIDGVALAFRRDDLKARGFLDEHFRLDLNLDIWWSLVLRDGGEDHPARRALAVKQAAGRALRHERPPSAAGSDRERDRLSKRSFYRVLDRFGSRRDLLTNHRRTPT